MKRSQVKTMITMHFYEMTLGIESNDFTKFLFLKELKENV